MLVHQNLLEADLSSLKLDTGKLDIVKLEITPADFSNLSNVVDVDFAKKTVHDELVKNVNASDTSGFVLKTQYNNNSTKMEGKIPNITGSATTVALKSL